MTDKQTHDAPEAGHHSGPIARAWSFVVNGLAGFGTVLICVLMFIICADIVARNALGSSLPLVSETGALLVVLIVALQLATTIHANRMARTEFTLVYLRKKMPRLEVLLEVLFSLAGMAVIGAIAWASIGILRKDFLSNEFIGTPGLGTLPTWPFRALIMLGMAVAAIEYFSRALSRLRRLFARGVS